MPSPLGITLTSMGQPSASCGHQPRNRQSWEQRSPQGLSVRPLLEQADSALLTSHPVHYIPQLKVQPLMSGHGTSATCFGGQYLPQEPKAWHEGTCHRPVSQLMC